MIDLQNKLSLVTGGAGFIGSHLVDCLLEQGARVRVLDDLSTGKLENISRHLEQKNFEFLQGSILDRGLGAEAMKGVSAVFNLACLGVRHSIRHPLENHLVNAEGTLALLMAASAAQTVECFAQVSSSEVYGTSRQDAMSEDHPTFPHTVYGAGKLAGDAYARAYHLTYGLPTVVIRPFNVFGPRSHYEGEAGEMIPKSVLRALTGHPILLFGDGTQERDFTYVTDTAQAIVQIARSGKFTGRTVNIGSGKSITMKALARAILDLTPETNAGMEHTDPRPGDVQRLLCDSSLVQKELGYKPQVELREGLARVVEWFRNQGGKLGEWYAKDTGRNWE